MAELVLTVSGRHLALPQNVPEQITNTEFIDAVRFECDSQYNGYELVAVFKNGEHGTPYPVAVPHDRSAVNIDPRALRRKGWLYVGMYGLDGLKVLPTLWAPAIEIKDGTDTSGTENPDDPVPSVYAALVARVGALEDAVDDLEETVDDLEDAVGDLETAVDQLGDTVSEIEGDVADLQTSKQDVITDLDTIRSGAAAGATALQSVPIASADNIGGAKFQAPFGLGINTTTGAAYINPATSENISNRNNNNRPITSTNMDTAFRTCITAPAQELTGEQKAAACATIGAEYKGVDNWVLVAELDREQTAFTVNLEGYTELMVLSAIEGNTSTHLLYNNGKLLINSAGINGKRSVKAEYKNYGWGGFAPIVCTRAGAIDNPTDCICDMGLAYGRMDNFTISDITNIYLSNTPTVYAHVEIYAR